MRATENIEVNDEILNEIHDIYECEVEYEYIYVNNSIGVVECHGVISHDDQEDEMQIETIKYHAGAKTHAQKLLLEVYIIANEEAIKEEIYKLNI